MLIAAFETGPYLVEMNRKAEGKRSKLPVNSPDEADAWLARGDALPYQPTTWNAVYHILQRYGAWVALTRYSDTFTADGGIAPKP